MRSDKSWCVYHDVYVPDIFHLQNGKSVFMDADVRFNDLASR